VDLRPSEPHDANAASRAVAIPTLVPLDLLFGDGMERRAVAFDHKPAIYIGKKNVGTEWPNLGLRSDLYPPDAAMV
jgi:hypothetical protein